MKDRIKDILQHIDTEIDEIDLYGYDIIETSLSMVRRLQNVLSELRRKYRVFSTKEDEILFFKTQKPEKEQAYKGVYEEYNVEIQTHQSRISKGTINIH